MSFARELKRRNIKKAKERAKLESKQEMRNLIASQFDVAKKLEQERLEQLANAEKGTTIEKPEMKFKSKPATVTTLEKSLLNEKLKELGSARIGLDLEFVRTIYPINVVGAFKYKCSKCGYTTMVYLQEGVEYTDNVDKKVTPFSLGCPKCKSSFMEHIDWHLDQKFNPSLKAPSKCDIFLYDKNSDVAYPTSIVENSAERLALSNIVLYNKNV